MNADRLLAHYEQIADAPDAIARLRRFVLDLAVRGKLVLQDARDEPTSELLKRIGREQARLVKAGEIRTPKPIPVLSETPFSIPANWRWSQLAEIGVLSPRNEAPDTLEASFVPMPLIAAEYGVVNQHEVRPWGEIKKGYTHFAEGDVGLAKITPCFENGKSTVFRNLIGGIGSGTTELHIVRPLFVDQDYILLFLKSPHFIETGIPKMTGTAGQKRVPTEYFAHSPFPLPPLAEQHRIVAKVDELMDLCDRLEAARGNREAVRDRLAAASLARLNAPDPTFENDARFALGALPALTTRPDQIQQLRQTILNLAVRGKLVPQDSNDEPASELLKRIAKEKARLLSAGEIKRDKPTSSISADDGEFTLPTSWRWCRLRSLASALGDGLHGTPNYARGTECYFVNGNNLEDGRIVIKPTTKTVSAEEMRKHKKPLNQYSVLVSINGTVGKVAFYDGEDVVLGKSACYFNLTEFTNKWFAKLVLDSPYFTNYAVKKATGTTIMNLSLKAMNEFPFPLPPLGEQQRIVTKVDALMALCDRLEASLTAAANTRRRLLEALLAEALAPHEEHELEAAE
jgi:type I restriction enzyme, S subunit